MIVVWTTSAVFDRDAIFDYIEADNPGAAVAQDQLFSARAQILAQFPCSDGRAAWPARANWSKATSSWSRDCRERHSHHPHAARRQGVALSVSTLCPEWPHRQAHRAVADSAFGNPVNVSTSFFMIFASA